MPSPTVPRASSRRTRTATGAAAVVLVCSLCSCTSTTTRPGSASSLEASASGSAPASTSASAAPAPRSSSPAASPTRSRASSAPVSSPAASPAGSATSSAAPTTSTSTQTGTGRAAPVITYAAWSASARAVQVSAYVPGLDTASARCSLVLTRGSQRRSISRAPVADATTMQCGTMSISGSRLSAGTWQATVRYSSPARSGVSAVVNVEVPR